ncbi:MAG: DUF2818 family protein [Gammaproteobacteria bacterium]
MSLQLAVWILITLALVAANLPWISERVLFVFPSRDGTKNPWWRLLELLILYFVVGGIAIGLEQKIYGSFQHQGWQFYAVTFCLFLVFALPGFIWRYDLKGHLENAQRRER